MGFKTSLTHVSVSMTFPSNSDNVLGFFAVSSPVPIDIIIFCEITAKRIPIIFSITSSLTLLCLLTLMNWSSLDSGSFVIFSFQLFTVLCLNSYCGYFELKCSLAACVLHTFLFSGLRLQVSILCWKPLHLLRWHALMISLSQLLNLLLGFELFYWLLLLLVRKMTLCFLQHFYFELIIWPFKHSNEIQTLKF